MISSISTTSFMEDLEKFVGGLASANAGDLIAAFVVIVILGAVMKKKR
ncbi:MAG TPA: hypothetical protein VLZ29_04480 [Sulfurimonas sp.]|nr:hypothetical protein [Sulfurimonas sp.]HUH42347.1 hypothetical protein [Sulfurimonas sp.]